MNTTLRGYLAGKGHFVRDDEHGHVLVGQLAHAAQHLAGELGVERRGRLVEEHDVGFHGQRTGDGDALLLPARKARGIAVALVEAGPPCAAVLRRRG
jgi:hypothetical protein